MKSLLLGNGINRDVRSEGIAWDQLLKNLCTQFGVNIDVDKTIPFPLVFEQIVNNKAGNEVDSKVKNLKQKISLIYGSNSIKPNDFHRKLWDLDNYSDILTTNYDYNIERAKIDAFVNNKVKYRMNALEDLLSMKRGYKIEEKKIWHIHGEQKSSKGYVSLIHYPEESIMIGFNHYAQYFQKIMDNVKNNSTNSSKSGNNIYEQKLINRILDPGYNIDECPYWVDRFFASDLDILGLTLDFSESHLWWLLSQRSEYKERGLVNNTIRYWYPSFPTQRKANSKELGIRKMLNSLKVEVLPVNASSYEDFYEKVLNILANRVKGQYLIQVN